MHEGRTLGAGRLCRNGPFASAGERAEVYSLDAHDGLWSILSSRSPGEIAEEGLGAQHASSGIAGNMAEEVFEEGQGLLLHDFLLY